MRRIWQERFVPTVFDLDVRGEVAPGPLCRFFGVAAGHHATELGLGDDTLRAQGLAWMLHRLEVRFLQASCGESPLSVETWPSDRSGRLRAERDFTISGESGIAVAVGVSTWLLIQLASRRPIRMPPRLFEVAVAGRPAPLEASSPSEEEPPLGAVQWTAPVTWTDLDINGHATFPRLVEWVLATAPPPHWAGNRLDAMVLRFEQEALPGEEVTGRFDIAGGNGLHILTKGDASVAVRGWTKWREL